MMWVEKLAIGAGIVVVATTAVYRYMLSDEQRESLQEAADVLRNATGEVTDSVRPLVGSGSTKAEAASRSEQMRAHTTEQWAALGY